MLHRERCTGNDAPGTIHREEKLFWFILSGSLRDDCGLPASSDLRPHHVGSCPIKTHVGYYLYLISNATMFKYVFRSG